MFSSAPLMPARPHRVVTARAVALVVALAAATVVAGCGSTPSAEGYTTEHREAFLAACTEAGSDPRLVRDVCECTFERIESTMPFEEFVALEQALRIDTLEPLPDPIAALMADCFIDQVEL